MARFYTLKSQSGDELVFARLTATEELGRLFSFRVEAVSPKLNLDLNALLGSPMSVKADHGEDGSRFFQGIVAEAEQVGFFTNNQVKYSRYRFLLVPKPWLLTRKADCRIYKKQSVPDIVKLLLSEAGYTDVKLSLSGTYGKRDYVVQYRETNFNFISRLMEQEGIYYYFSHDASTHTMVLADDLGAHVKLKPKAELPYRPLSGVKGAGTPAILSFQPAHSVQSLVYKLGDYDPTSPSTDLGADYTQPQPPPKLSKLEIYDYPADYDAKTKPAELGERYPKVRLQALNAQQKVCSGETDAPGLAAGTLFTLSAFPQSEVNAEYLIVSSSTEMAEGGYLSGDTEAVPLKTTFRAIEGKHPFRAAQVTARPVIAGMQTAVVCGSDTDEDIVVDKDCRVQVIFHWQTKGRPHHDISCPVRVASFWAGKQWGAVHIPRVGQEVVVSFLEGDPDRPLIIGSVYNANNMPPYELPANKTQSGIKSRSHEKGTAANYNEFRFEDKKGKEEILLHAEKDHREEVENDHFVEIGHDETEHIGHDRKHTIDNDEVFTIKNDRTHVVNGFEKVTIDKDRTHTVKGSETITVNGDSAVGINGKQDVTIGKTYVLDVADEITIKTGSSVISMKKDGTIKISGVSITIDASADLNLKSGTGMALEAGTNLDGKANVNMSLQAGVQMSLKGDAMFSAEGSGMAELKGAMVTVKGDGMTQVSGGIIMIG